MKRNICILLLLSMICCCTGCQAENPSYEKDYQETPDKQEEIDNESDHQKTTPTKPRVFIKIGKSYMLI